MLVRKGVVKNSANLTEKPPLLESLFNKFAGLTPIMKNMCQRLLLHCTRTSRCYSSFLAYIQHLQRQPPEVFCQKKMFLEILQKACNFIKKDTLAQVFSCEFCGTSRNMFSAEPATEHLQATASAPSSVISLLLLLISPMFVFRSNSKGFKEFEPGISFSLSRFHRFYYLFPCFFCLSQFCFIFFFFFAAYYKKNSFKLKID